MKDMPLPKKKRLKVKLKRNPLNPNKKAKEAMDYIDSYINGTRIKRSELQSV